MLSNVRRKIVQKDIKTYLELKIEDWWNSDIIAYLHENRNFGNQRYSKSKVKKDFEKSKNSMLIPYEIDGKVYNMIPCPSGSFIKGSNALQDDKPLEEKKIEKSFLLGETEITQELYCAVMGVENPSYFKKNPKNPVENVSWYDAVMFCNKMSDKLGLERYYTITWYGQIIDIIKKDEDYKIETNENSKGFRLPTEWEWEYATKAGTQLEYSGSNDPNEVGWHSGNSKNKTKPVKGRKPNAWGFYDMSGNVQEWCENLYDPNNKYNSNLRVVRGGCWNSNALLLRSANRYSFSPAIRNPLLGFRIARYI